MNSVLRVTALMDTQIVSGPGRQLAAIVDPLRALGVELQVVTFQRHGRPPGDFARFLEQAGIPSLVVRERGRIDLAAVDAVVEAARGHGAHLIQSHSYKPAAVAAMARRRLQVPWIGFFHGVTLEDAKVRLYNWLDRRLLRLADAAVVVAEPQLGVVVNHRGGVRVIANAVLPPPPHAPLDPATLPGSPRVGVIGRLSHEKGVDIFLEAMHRLRGRGIACHGLVVGDGPARAELEAQRATLDLTSTVTFLGHRGDAQAFYAHLDVVVLPSRSEGMPNVLLEALAAGRPAVATAVGGVPDILRDPEAGALVPAGDPDALATAIQDALSGRYSSDASVAAREAVRERFSLPARALALRQLYDDVRRVPRARA